MSTQHDASVFIGREQELKLLNNCYRQQESAFVPVYGRRRVGKSELILKFIENKRALYFLGKKAPSAMQQQELSQELALVFNEPLFAALSPTSWRQVLQIMTEKIQTLTKFVLVLDEFQWMAQASPELPSLLQEFWDRYWSRNDNVVLILCGSYLGFMEREVLGEKSPLFGRRTAQIFLQPLDYVSAAKFYPDHSVIDKAKVYFICGGIPAYLKLFSATHSINTNIANNFLNEFSPLFREPEFLLKEELKELDRYYAILMALAARSLPVSQIAQQTGIDVRQLYYYLQSLTTLGYVAKKYPLITNKPSKHSVLYTITDPLLRFWFRYIYPNTTYIARVNAQQALSDKILPTIESYFGMRFEHLCREALPNLYWHENTTLDCDIGEYWNQEVQIDVVSIRQDNVIDIGECKWGKIPSIPKLITELEQKIQAYPNPKQATIQGRLFLKTQRKLPKNTRIKSYSLADLYES